MDRWYKISIRDALTEFGVEPAHGLTDAEADKRVRQYGPNELVERGIKSPWAILWEQLTAIMVVILIVAAVVSFALGEWTDGIAILAIVLVNAVLGVRQEYKAEKAMAALKKLAVPNVRVRRGGAVESVSAHSLVPGDIVLLDAGSHVPADCRIVESANLHTEEAALTGESVPVEKSAEWSCDGDTPVADRLNMVYMGTSVTYGRAACLVTATGMRTELGKIAAMIQSVDRSATPLQVRLDHLGKVLAIVAFALVAIIFGLGLWREGTSHLRVLFLTSVSMAVAAVPEGLPAVVTIALALGAQRMLARHALIRKLLAVEALGSVTVICSDKTGTLTENRMTVRTIITGSSRFETPLSSETAQSSQELLLTLMAGALCNDAELSNNKTESTAHGDPTEVALAIVAVRAGLGRNVLEPSLPRIAEVPFDSVRKRMTTLHKVDGEISLPNTFGNSFPRSSFIAFSKGSVNGLLTRCDRILLNGETCALDDQAAEQVLRQNDALAQEGLRVLGFAYAPYDVQPKDTTAPGLEQGMVFTGLMALHDPPRPEVKDAVALCKSAGIQPIMITGDHPLTARYIAAELGISPFDGRVLTGAELDRMSEDDRKRAVHEVSVFARVTPESKLEIVTALQEGGHVVAMTGDGVNDAPALKKANIGVAMGITGTDVSKEASDMVLLDDNFATIVASVAEGRTIYDNIRKFINYLMTTNSAELWVMIAAPFLGMPLPLLPLQILWMNLVTDGLPALALGVEPPERNVMRRPPIRANESIFAGGAGMHMILVGLLMALISLAPGWYYWRLDAAPGDGNMRWQTIVFTILTLSQMANVLAIRSGTDSLFKVGLWSNPPLVWAVLATIALQFVLIYTPGFQGIFDLVPLSGFDILLAVVLSSIVFWVIEIEKYALRASGRARER